MSLFLVEGSKEIAVLVHITGGGKAGMTLKSRHFLLLWAIKVIPWIYGKYFTVLFQLIPFKMCKY